MFVNAGAGQKAPSLVAPFILQIGAVNAHTLFYIVVVAHSYVVQAVERVFDTGHQLGRHEQKAVHGVCPLAAGGDYHIGGASVCVGVHIRAIVALAVCVLGGGEHRQMVAVVAQPQVVRGLARMYVVVGLLGNHGHVGRHFQLVASAAVFMCVVVLHGELADVGGTEKAAGSQGLGFQLGHLGESVAVVVIAVAVAALTVNEKSGQTVVGHHRSVEGGVVVESARRTYGGKLMRHLCRVYHRVFGNDVDGAANSR